MKEEGVSIGDRARINLEHHGPELALRTTAVGATLVLNERLYDLNPVNTGIILALGFGIPLARQGYHTAKNMLYGFEDARDEAGEVLRLSEEKVPPKDSQTAFREMIVDREKESWKGLLGTEIDVSPFPSSISLRKVRKLNRLGLAFYFIPKIEVPETNFVLEDLSKDADREYQNFMTSQFPNWYMSEDALGILNRDLDYELWYKYVKGDTPSPSLSGQWVAIESLYNPYPNLRKHPYSPFLNRFGINRKQPFSVVSAEILKKKKKVLTNLGISPSSADVRAPRVLEWYLLRSRIEGMQDGEFTDTPVTIKAGDYFQKEPRINIEGRAIVSRNGIWFEDHYQKRYTKYRFGIFFDSSRKDASEV